MDEDDCPDCQGTGIGDPHGATPCPECGGRGYIVEEDFEEPDDDDYDNPEDDFAYDPPGMRDPD